MRLMDFPEYHDAPMQLLLMEGNCGPVTIWATLRHFKKRASSKRIIESCRYSKKHGTFAIAITTALRKFGLNVAFFTESDPSPHLIEQQGFRLADQIGVSINPAVDLKFLRSQIGQGRLPIVIYDAPDDEGHFSPLLDVVGGKVILPFDQKKEMSVREFQSRWAAPGFCRQCMVVWRER